MNAGTADGGGDAALCPMDSPQTACPQASPAASPTWVANINQADIFPEQLRTDIFPER